MEIKERVRAMEDELVELRRYFQVLCQILGC